MRPDPTLNLAAFVVCAGPFRSGSTWQFNAVRLAFLAAGYRTYSDYSETYVRSTSAEVHVLKTHPFDPEAAGHANTVLTTYRDVRDAVASMVRRGHIPNTPAAAADCARLIVQEQYAPWRPHAHLTQRYEDLVAAPETAIKALLEGLGLADRVSVAEVQRDLEKLGRIALAGRCRTTQLWPGHRTNGKPASYRETLDPETVVAVEAIAGDWLRAHDYPVPG